MTEGADSQAPGSEGVAMPVEGKRRVIIIASALTLLGATLALLAYTEPVPARFWFALAVTAAITSALAFLSRRLLFSSILIFALVALVCLCSLEKKAVMNMALHSYDLVFYVNAETIEFLGRLSPLSCRSGRVAGCGFDRSALTWRFDRLRLSRLTSGLALILAVTAAAALQSNATAQGGAFRMFVDDSSYVSAFYLSWSDTWRTLARGQLVEAAAQTALPDFAGTVSCTPQSKPPHIVLIHQELLVPPSLFPNLQYDHTLDRFFFSDDDQLHRLTRGDVWRGSWVTEFALLTGISTKAFGDMRMFVQVLMSGRLKETLPQSLVTCGYRTLMLFPMSSGFVSLDRFYRSIGFSEVLDPQGARRADHAGTRPLLFSECARCDGQAFQIVRPAAVRLRSDHGVARSL